MPTLDELETRLVALEQMTLEQLAQIRGKVFPPEEQGIAQGLEGMHRIYNHQGSPKPGAKPPAPSPDNRSAGMAGIYRK